MLSDLAFPFDLIDLTETKIKSDHDPASNISIPDYEFISLPTLTNAGGVGFYIKKNLNFHIRNDSVCNEAESLWIEIDNQKNKNIICAVIYRHPNANLNAFQT